MMSLELIGAWAADHHGAGRVSDGGHVFWVAMASGGPVVVRKATGAAWHLDTEPPNRAVFGMPSQAMFRRALRTAGQDPDRPHHLIPLTPPPPLPPAASSPVTHEQVLDWMRARFDWRHIEDRVDDLGWAYRINTQTDAYLDTGDPMQGAVGGGPVMVVKRTRGAWFSGSSPYLLPAHEARDEQHFHTVLASVFRTHDPARPDERLPDPS